MAGSRVSRKQLKETLVKNKVRLDTLLGQDVSLHAAMTEFDKQAELFDKFQRSIQKSIDRYQDEGKIEKVMKLQAEFHAVKDMYQQSCNDYDLWVDKKRQRIAGTSSVKQVRFADADAPSTRGKRVRKLKPPDTATTPSRPDTPIVKQAPPVSFRLPPPLKDDALSVKGPEPPVPSVAKKEASPEPPLVGATAGGGGGARPKEGRGYSSLPPEDRGMGGERLPPRSSSDGAPPPPIDENFIDHLADSIIKKCGWDKLQAGAQYTFSPKVTSSPFTQAGISTDRKDPISMIISESMSSQMAEDDSCISSDSEMSVSDVGSPLGPQISVSDVLHGYGRIPGARCIGTEGPLEREKRVSAEAGQERVSYDKFMSKIDLPVFDGTTNFDSWWSVFQALVDGSAEPVAVKFLRFRTALSGEPLKLIECLPHDGESYLVAKRRIFDNYGGLQRNINRLYLDVQSFPVIERTNEFGSFRSLLSKLDHLTQQLRSAHWHAELGHGALVNMMVSKMPYVTIEKYHEWRYSRNKADSLISLGGFLEEYISRGVISLETSMASRPRVKKEVKTDKQEKSSRTTMSVSSNPPQPSQVGSAQSVAASSTGGSNKIKNKCKGCGGPHPLWFCNKFKGLSLDKRWGFVKKNGVCFKCLSPRHSVQECKSTRECRGAPGCSAEHHTLLHRTKTEVTRSSTSISPAAPPAQQPPAGEGQVKNTHLVVNEDRYLSRTISLRVLPVRVYGPNGSMIVNALLDDASTTTYLNETVAQQIGLSGRVIESEVNVIDGRKVHMETSLVDLTVESTDGSCRLTEVAEISSQIVKNLTVILWDTFQSNWPHLAECEFHPMGPKPEVDLLLGSNFIPLMISNREVVGPPGTPSARLCPLGWTCIGSPIQERQQPVKKSTYLIIRETLPCPLSRSVEKFWEWESLPVKSPMSAVDRLAEKIVHDSMMHDGTRYTVSIPWTTGERPYVPENRTQAERRLMQTERKLLRHPDLARMYDNVFLSYLEKGYLEEVLDDLAPKGKVWYMSHFAIIRMGAATTKVRPVFDGSAEYLGISINQYEMAGPKSLQDLVKVLLRFRRFPVALVCDITEMFLQILVDLQDRDYQRVLWRFMNIDNKIRTFRFTRVMFGKKSSPYLALAVSQANARAHQEEFPLAAPTVLCGTYMDDSLDSVLTEALGIQLFEELKGPWGCGGMRPHKWATNSLTVLEQIPVEQRAAKVDLQSPEPGTQKMLGLGWWPEFDIFVYEAVKVIAAEVCTKRTFLKTVAKVFDPLGFLGPYLMRGKVYLQMMWVGGLDWDEELTQDIGERVQEWLKDLIHVTGVKVDRSLVRRDSYLYCIIHIFVDASLYAYGAVSYAVTYYPDGPPTVALVMAKGRVAPLSSVSIPRLELEAALVGSCMAEVALEAVEGMNVRETCLWSDSQDVLFWIHSIRRVYKIYAANRIAKIQEKTSPAQWKYVATADNPADILSRGMSASDLAKSQRWLQGPAFLLLPEAEWPQQPLFAASAVTEAEKRSNAFSFLIVRELPCFIDITRFSSFLRLARVTAWVLRFLSACRRKRGVSPRKILAMEDLEPLGAEEIMEARCLLYRGAQEDVWKGDVRRLEKGEEVAINSVIRGLLPWLDEAGVIRGTMRTKHAELLNWDAIYPVLLPRGSRITRLVIADVHASNHHISTEHTVTKIRQRYFVPALREVVREVVKDCMRCKILLSKPTGQVMADLPFNRVNSTRVFEKASLDFAGPFYIKMGRGRVQQKRWVCLFDCLAVRAVHLEICHSMDTDSFLMAVSRFTNQHGTPSDIYADNGTNIVSGEREIREYVQGLDQKAIISNLSSSNVRWHFQPPAAPHFGGAHEALVKSMKRALWKTAGKANLTEEEFKTACSKVQGTMNARPLTYNAASMHDEPALTPANFFVGTYKAEAIPITGKVPELAAKRWSYVEKVAAHYWKRWREEFLPRLGPRSRWLKTFPDVKVKDVVHVLDRDTPRGHWPLGMVERVFPGSDGHVRAVEVRVGAKLYRRPVVKICPLGV